MHSDNAVKDDKAKGEDVHYSKTAVIVSQMSALVQMSGLTENTELN